MSDQKILTIQDISCVGQCSLTVALPIISACGLETCILPSAVLSTHTGGFTGYTFRDLTEDIPGIQKHWEQQGIRFDAIYTGYLGSAKQIDYVLDIFQNLSKPNCNKIVDPAMADNGKMYPGFDETFAKKMASLCAEADIIIPNITEACFLTGAVYREEYDEAYIQELLEKLSSLGAKAVILTGVSYEPDQTGVIVYEQGKAQYYSHRRISVGSHGTGDVYASAFTGALMRGHEKYQAAKIAADYTVECILNTIGDESHWYGVKFESVLPKLIKAVNRITDK